MLCVCLPARVLRVAVTSPSILHIFNLWRVFFFSFKIKAGYLRKCYAAAYFCKPDRQFTQFTGGLRIAHTSPINWTHFSSSYLHILHVFSLIIIIKQKQRCLLYQILPITGNEARAILNLFLPCPPPPLCRRVWELEGSACYLQPRLLEFIRAFMTEGKMAERVSFSPCYMRCSLSVYETAQ